MRNLFVCITILLAFCDPLPAQQSNTIQGMDGKYRMLFDCARQVLRFFPDANEGVALDDDLLYVLDGEKNELYVFTPFFAGKTNYQADAAGRKIAVADGSFFRYRIRIPYLSHDPKKTKGYYYLDVDDAPSAPHPVAQIDFPARFLEGEPMEKPDFSDARRTPNGITVLSMGGENLFAKSADEYHALDIEPSIWETKNGNISKDGMDRLAATAASRIDSMPGKILPGEPSPCSGFRGCDSVVGQRMTDSHNSARSAVLNSCHAAEDRYHLGLFRPKHYKNARIGE